MTDHGLDVPILGRSAFGLRASSGSDQPGRNADWIIGGDLRKASGRAERRAVRVPALLSAQDSCGDEGPDVQANAVVEVGVPADPQLGEVLSLGAVPVE